MLVGSLPNGRSILFRYPPIPQNSAINIYGHMERLEFGEAIGVIKVGPRERELKTGTAVRLEDISSLKTVRGSLPLPILVNPNRRTAMVGLSASARVYLDGKSATRFIDDRGNIILFLAIVSATCTVWTLVLRLADRRATRRTLPSN